MNKQHLRSNTETVKMCLSRNDNVSRYSSSHDDLRYSSSRNDLRYSMNSLGSMAYSLDSFDVMIFEEEEGHE